MEFLLDPLYAGSKDLLSPRVCGVVVGAQVRRSDATRLEDSPRRKTE